MQAPPSYSEITPSTGAVVGGTYDGGVYIPLDSPFIKEEDVDLMMSMSMGWPKSFCQVALIRCAGNLNEAMNMLMENNEAVMSQFVREYKANQMLLAERANGGRRQSMQNQNDVRRAPTLVPVQRANKRWSFMGMFGGKDKEASSINLTNGAVNTSPSRSDEPHQDVENYFSSAMDENTTKQLSRNIEVIPVDGPPGYDMAPPLYEDLNITPDLPTPSFEQAVQEAAGQSHLKFDNLLVSETSQAVESIAVASSDVAVTPPESLNLIEATDATTATISIPANSSDLAKNTSPPPANLKPRRPPRSSLPVPTRRLRPLQSRRSRIHSERLPSRCAWYQYLRCRRA